MIAARDHRPASMLYGRLPSPVGDVLMAGDGRALWAVWIEGQRWAPVIGPAWRETVAPFDRARRQLQEYFAGERTTFALPLRLGGTVFQNEVWSELLSIPFGETRSYGAMARALGRPRAARAVGAPKGQNPFCIMIPSHRLIGSGGGLVD
jgi:methylated-DNA-[protein]-cysteine S-methyltransferase